MTTDEITTTLATRLVAFIDIELTDLSAELVDEEELSLEVLHNALLEAATELGITADELAAFQATD